jgi:hypothetical protein
MRSAPGAAVPAWQLRESAKREAWDFNSSQQYTSAARLHHKTLRRRHKEEIDLAQLPSGFHLAVLASRKTPIKCSGPTLGDMEDKDIMEALQVIVQRCSRCRQQSQHTDEAVDAPYERTCVVARDSVGDTILSPFAFTLDLDKCDDKSVSTCSTLTRC